MTDKYLTLWNTFIRPSRKSYESKKKNKSSDGTVDIAILYNEFNNYSHNTVNCHHNNFTNPEFDVEYSFVFLYFILVEIKKWHEAGNSYVIGI